MKRIWLKNKWVLLFLINTLPFLLDIAFYKNGAMDDLFLFFPVFAGLTILNFKNCSKTLHFVFLQVYIIICAVCSGYISMNLHYNYLASDFMTLLVGTLFIFLGAVIGIIITIVSVVAKVITNKKQTKSTDC